MIEQILSYPWFPDIMAGLIAGIISAFLLPRLAKLALKIQQIFFRKFVQSLLATKMRISFISFGIGIISTIIINNIGCTGDGSKYGFEGTDTIWRHDFDDNESAVKHFTISSKQKKKGKSSLAFEIHLQYPSESDTAGNVYVDLRLDPRFNDEVNMTNKIITCWVFVPEDFPIPHEHPRHCPNLRLFLKDAGTNSLYGHTMEIDIAGHWIPLELSVNPQPGEGVRNKVRRDINFEPSMVRQLGIKISANPNWPIRYEGKLTFYLDAVDW